MAVSVVSSGSQTAVIGTEHTLDTITAAGVYQLVVDVSNLADGSTPDIVEFRVYGKARSSDSEMLLYSSGEYQGNQSLNLKASVAVVSPHHAKFTLIQRQGTGRAFPWAVYGS